MTHLFYVQKSMMNRHMKKKHENQAQTFFNVTESAKDQVCMSFMFFYNVPSISDGNVSKANI